jgi:hypothetical protein
MRMKDFYHWLSRSFAVTHATVYQLNRAEAILYLEATVETVREYTSDCYHEQSIE